MGTRGGALRCLLLRSERRRFPAVRLHLRGWLRTPGALGGCPHCLAVAPGTEESLPLRAWLFRCLESGTGPVCARVTSPLFQSQNRLGWKRPLRRPSPAVVSRGRLGVTGKLTSFPLPETRNPLLLRRGNSVVIPGCRRRWGVQANPSSRGLGHAPRGLSGAVGLCSSPLASA